jgi:hypothetical protein
MSAGSQRSPAIKGNANMKTERDLIDDFTEIELTPAMIEAGAEELCCYDPDRVSSGAAVVEIWSAMMAARRRS